MNAYENLLCTSELCYDYSQYENLLRTSELCYDYSQMCQKNNNFTMRLDVNLKDQIEKVIFNNPATIVIWKDKTKTIVRCIKDDIYDPEKGLAMCFAKRLLGNEGSYYNIFSKWLPKKKENNICMGCPFDEPPISDI